MIKWVSKFLPSWLSPPAFLAIVIAIALTVIFTWLTGFFIGRGYERTQWQEYENQELIKRQERILHLETINRALEKHRVIQAQNAEAKHIKEMQDAKDRETALLAQLRTGDKRLFINTKALRTCRSESGWQSTARSESHASQRAELSNTDAEFLIRFATEADEAVIEGNRVKQQLINCRAHIDALIGQFSANAMLFPRGVEAELKTNVQLRGE